MKIASTISDLQDGMRLDYKTANALCTAILDESLNGYQVAAVLSLMSARTFAVSEVLGFRGAIKARGTSLDLGNFQAVDLCGTGGDGKYTFNISTASAFIVAALGFKVIKHGNYAVSSKSGSSDILQALGYEFTIDETRLKRDLESANICFLHAPLFYPILKSVGPIRRELGFKTIFNVLGPLLNPANVKCALTGVYDLSVFRLYSEILPQILDSYYVVHTIDGYDEVSLTAPMRIIGSAINTEFDPSKGCFFGVKVHKVNETNLRLCEVNPKEKFIEFLKGQANSDLNEVVAINAALAISTLKKMSFIEAHAKSLEAIKLGAGFKVLKRLVEA